MASVEDIYYIVNQAIDLAFTREKYQLNFFNYLHDENFRRVDVVAFLESSLYTSIKHQIEELDLYLLGGVNANDLREAYNWMGKPRARKVKEYLMSILEDAERYEQSKRTRKKKKEVATKDK